MGAGASAAISAAITASSPVELAAALSTLPPEVKAKLSAVLAEKEDMAASNEALNVVIAAYTAWGTGAYLNDGAEKLIAEHVAADGDWDPTGYDFQNTDMYKVYKGHAGWAKWIKRLSEIEFKDFKPEFFPGKGGKVMVYTSYRPTVKATGKTGALMHDMQLWVIKNGKVQSINFNWGTPAALDALFKK